MDRSAVNTIHQLLQPSFGQILFIEGAGGKGTGPTAFQAKSWVRGPSERRGGVGGVSSEARGGAPSPEQGKDSKWERILSEKVPEWGKGTGLGLQRLQGEGG